MAEPDELRQARIARAAQFARGKSTPPTLAAKADDLEAIKKVVDDAASVSGGLWLSYLFVLFYIAIAAGAVTHQDLLLQSPVKLPFLNIELPLIAFFALAPFLLVITHAYALLHFIMLGKKATRFSEALKVQLPDVVEAPKECETKPKDIRDQLRRLLPSNIFVQILAGPPELRQGAVGLVMQLIAWTTLIFAPILVLLLLQFQYLPFHQLWATWAQRIALFIDVVLIWVLYAPTLFQIEFDKLSLAQRLGLATAFGASSIAIWLSVVIATIPGEWQERALTDRFDSEARQILFNGVVNNITRRRRSLFSNILVLPGFDIYNALKVEDPSKLAWKKYIFNLRGRHLEQAVFEGANLTKIDFEGANLRGATLTKAQLQGASFREAWLRDTTLDQAKLQGTVFDEAQLQRASLDASELQGASLVAAQLQDASFAYAQLQGASLQLAQLQAAWFGEADAQGALFGRAQLQGAWLIRAKLKGAELYQAQLQGALLDMAELQGAELYQANLQGADLNKANLQGAKLNEAQLQGASLVSAKIDAADFTESFLWRTDLTNIDPLKITVMGHEGPRWDPVFFNYNKAKISQWDGKAYMDFHSSLETGAGRLRKDRGLIKRLDCANNEENLASCDLSAPTPRLVKEWQQRVKILDDAAIYGKALRPILQDLICASDVDAVHVLRNLILKSFAFSAPHLLDTGPETPALVDFIMSDKCPVSSSLSTDDKARLLKIKQWAITGYPLNPFEVEE